MCHHGTQSHKHDLYSCTIAVFLVLRAVNSVLCSVGIARGTALQCARLTKHVCENNRRGMPLFKSAWQNPLTLAKQSPNLCVLTTGVGCLHSGLLSNTS